MPKEDNEYEYPLVMKGTQSGRIVNMTAYGKGTVVGTGNDKTRPGCIGQYSDGWMMHNFKPYKG